MKMLITLLPTGQAAHQAGHRDGVLMSLAHTKYLHDSAATA